MLLNFFYIPLLPQSPSKTRYVCGSAVLETIIEEMPAQVSSALKPKKGHHMAPLPFFRSFISKADWRVVFIPLIIHVFIVVSKSAEF